MTPDEFKARWSSKIPALGGQNPADSVADDAAAKARSLGATAANGAKQQVAKAAVAPSQADEPIYKPSPQTAEALNQMFSKPTPTKPEPAEPLPTEINPMNVAKNLWAASPPGMLQQGAQSAANSVVDELKAAPGQMRSLAEKLKEQARQKALQLSTTPK